MGQKVNPIGFRLSIVTECDSIWYADGKDYAEKLHQDLAIKKMVRETLMNAGVSKMTIRRFAKKKLSLEIKASRPGVVIGKKGVDVDKLKTRIEKMTNCEVSINIQEIRRPELDAKLVGINIAQQLEKRVAFRKAAKRALQTAMKMGAQGIRINVSGRLGGAEIARTEWYREGRVPLHTLRANIDYAIAEASTTYGIIGVKVWIYKGDVDAVTSSKRIKDMKSYK
jgi:small subunit ribosomal protein S3